LILILTVLLLALGACTPAETPTEEPAPPTSSPTDAMDSPEPTNVPEPEDVATPYPDVAAEPTKEPTPYPEPEIEKPTSNDAADAYPGPEEVTWPLIVTDDLGNAIELTEYPQAIVSISASTTEILFAIGAGDQVVGRDDFSLYPDAALEVESIGGLFEGVPTEAILALEPDLVVAAEIISEENVQVLRDLDLPVYWQANPTDFEGLYENLLDLAEITGHTAETKALVADLQTRVSATEAAIANAEDTPVVFYELDASMDTANPWTAGSGTFIDYIITMAGGVNAAAALEGDYAQISVEELIAVNPEIILLSDALYGVTPESVAERPGWDAILAVQNGAMYPIDPNMMSVPGPRLVDALEETAQIVHPELFE
jgi:iron complex transport system substrate-binding protein